MTRRPSILGQAFAYAARTLAEREDLPQENRQAFCENFHSVMREALGLYAGDRITSRLRSYWSEASPNERQQQRRRILEALDQGQSPAAIAIKEGVTPQWVRVLRAKHAKAQAQRNG
jgi:hypothetical protein